MSNCMPRLTERACCRKWPTDKTRGSGNSSPRYRPLQSWNSKVYFWDEKLFLWAKKGTFFLWKAISRLNLFSLPSKLNSWQNHPASSSLISTGKIIPMPIWLLLTRGAKKGFATKLSVRQNTKVAHALVLRTRNKCWVQSQLTDQDWKYVIVHLL